MSSGELADILADVAAVGPFFRVRVVPPERLGPGATLAAFAGGGPALTERVAATGQALGTDEARVASSILFQGIAARLWSPTLAVAAAWRRVLHLPPQDTVLDEEGLACSRPALSPSFLPTATLPTATEDGDTSDERGCAELAARLYRTVVDTHLEPLAAAFDVPPASLWGNAASAAVGSYRVLVDTRPELADAGLLAGLLGTGRLRDTGHLESGDRFRRASCCLFYRIPGGGLCGDCVLHRRTAGSPPDAIS